MSEQNHGDTGLTDPRWFLFEGHAYADFVTTLAGRLVETDQVVESLVTDVVQERDHPTDQSEDFEYRVRAVLDASDIDLLAEATFSPTVEDWVQMHTYGQAGPTARQSLKDDLVTELEQIVRQRVGDQS